MGRPAQIPERTNEIGEFIKYGREQGVGPLVYSALSRTHSHHPVTAALQPEYASSLAQGLKQKRLLECLSAEASQRGLHACVLKGPAIAQLYGDPARRPMKDLDLWIKVEEQPSWQRVFTDLRFNRPTISDVYVSGWGQVDLHTSLVDATRFPERKIVFNLREDTVWKRNRPVPGHPSMLNLAPGDALMHLIVHGLKHGFSRLIWLCDIALITRILTPEDWRQIENKPGRASLVRIAGNLVEAQLGIRFRKPQGKIHSAERVFCAACVKPGLVSFAETSYIYLKMRNPIERMGYLKRVVFPHDALAEIESRFGVSAESNWALFLRLAHIIGASLRAASQSA